jgi:hypothetical protein
MKTKNSSPSSEFEEEDKCPSCGSTCNIHTDLDDNDNCNECRIFEDNLETASIDYRDKSDDENTDEETMLINVNWYDKQEAFIAGAKWQKEKTIEEVFEWLTTNDYLTDLKQTLIENFKKNKI